ncbi:MAG: VTT domain-containing protein [Ignisphaera sp.]|nr:VTT domain-containing protein [Ignisphaera sp.]MCX8167493.1 VTT domain-containing protein [Ignisphaera sp.]MDW8084643.1 VTT domain-containing protein [Ignisphaera sp.]
MVASKDVLRVLESYLPVIVLVIVSVAIFSLRKLIIRVLLGFNGFIVVLLLSLISCLSVVPIPYTYIVFLIATAYKPNLIIISLGGALGSTLGEGVAWFLGRAGSSALQRTKYFHRIELILRYTKSRSSLALPLLAFIFALTPLPDKIIFLPLGMLRYNPLKVLPATFFGKFVMNIVVIIVGQLWGVVGEEILGLGEVIMFIATTIILIAIMSIMMFVRWEEIIKI